MLDLWLAKDNRFLNPKSSYERILLAPPCRLITTLFYIQPTILFQWPTGLSLSHNMYLSNFHLAFASFSLSLTGCIPLSHIYLVHLHSHLFHPLFAPSSRGISFLSLAVSRSRSSCCLTFIVAPLLYAPLLFTNILSLTLTFPLLFQSFSAIILSTSFWKVNNDEGKGVNNGW